MRLAAQAKMGYYPCPADAVAMVAARLCPPSNGQWSLLDPCAGEGAAIRQLAELTGCQPERVHAIELDEVRGNVVRENLPNGRVLAPASTLGTHANVRSFEAIWCNPPFDYAYDGERVELQFLEHVTPWLQHGGVMVLICPESVFEAGTDCYTFMATWFDEITVLPFPDSCRTYNEVAVIGIRRKEPRAVHRYLEPQDENWLAVRGHEYQIPSGPGPKVFIKTEPTPKEYVELFAASPLQRFLAPPPSTKLPSPPLSLGTGHIALLLAAGQLDGLVCPPGEQPHVIRGSAHKLNKVISCEETLNDQGKVTGTKTVQRETIHMVIRMLTADGEIITLSEGSHEQPTES